MNLSGYDCVVVGATLVPITAPAAEMLAVASPAVTTRNAPLQITRVMSRSAAAMRQSHEFEILDLVVS